MSKDPRSGDDPLAPWSRTLLDLMDKLHRRSFVEFRIERAWRPRINLYDASDRVVLCVDLAGLDRDSVSIECADGARLKVSGRRDRPTPPDSSTAVCGVEEMEIEDGAFARDVDLPSLVDAAALQVEYERGYLWIVLPKLRSA